ncbi:RNase H domain-containing protein [Trichonephila clavipes]|uniref:RNase H domain-containing protein n=1 Tax=Trichonephila clavipes TaxID=2585209 RepID=A0A8X6RZ90_TRICX|nr:RNase H domain-containing protein [Trichonephila clavipes]
MAGFVTSSSPVPLKTRCVEERCTLNLSRAQTSSRWCGVVVRREGSKLRCRPRHLTMVQNDVVQIAKFSISVTKLKRVSTSHQIHLQWISTLVDLEGNEIADTLAKAGACEVPELPSPLTFLEIFSRTEHQNKSAWIVPPEHHWYLCSRPGGSLAHGFKRQEKTLLVHFRSGHLKTIEFSEGFMSFEI